MCLCETDGAKAWLLIDYWSTQATPNSTFHIAVLSSYENADEFVVSGVKGDCPLNAGNNKCSTARAVESVPFLDSASNLGATADN